MTETKSSKTNPNQVYEHIAAMVDEAMISLKSELELYQSPLQKTAKGKPKTGLSAFADDAGISRSNLQVILNPRTDQQMSTWLFIKITQFLGYWPQGWDYTPSKSMETQNVKTAMITPRDPMMVVLARLLSS